LLAIARGEVYMTVQEFENKVLQMGKGDGWNRCHQGEAELTDGNKVIDTPLKSTLFGKFYEGIVLGWLKENKHFTPSDGKPRIYWKDLEPISGDSQDAIKLNKSLAKYKAEKQFCTPDGLLQKEDKSYIWEAKNWPHWKEGKTEFNQLKDVLLSLPQMLATEADYKKEKKTVHGFLFSWWSEPMGANALIEEIRTLIAPRSFEIFYTKPMLEDCIEKLYPWYVQIVDKEKLSVEKFFKDLLGTADR
jgi:hypothetical protein